MVQEGSSDTHHRLSTLLWEPFEVVLLLRAKTAVALRF